MPRLARTSAIFPRPTMNRPPLRSLLCAALAWSATGLGAAEVDHHGSDAGGGRNGSASYRNHGAIGATGGVSTGPLSGVVNRAGFVAQLNETPELPTRILTRPPGRALKIDASILANGLVDPEGDLFVVEDVDATSAASVTVRPDGRWLLYEAAPGAPEIDTFTYRVVDALGDRIEGVVEIRVDHNATPGESRTLLRIDPLPDGLSYRISFVGIPGRGYQVQTATQLPDGPWTTLGLSLAGPDGLYAISHTPPAGEPARFYRAVHQP